MTDEEYAGAKDYALRLLSGREYTRFSLIKKIATRYERSVAERAAERMEELGLIDDSDYACRMAHDLINLKNFAPRRVRQELSRRGISEDDIDLALIGYSSEEGRERLAEVLLRRYERAFCEEKEQRRAVSALIRMGYSYDDIQYVFRHIDEFLED